MVRLNYDSLHAECRDTQRRLRQRCREFENLYLEAESRIWRVKRILITSISLNVIFLGSLAMFFSLFDLCPS